MCFFEKSHQSDTQRKQWVLRASQQILMGSTPGQSLQQYRWKKRRNQLKSTCPKIVSLIRNGARWWKMIELYAHSVESARLLKAWKVENENVDAKATHRTVQFLPLPSGAPKSQVAAQRLRIHTWICTSRIWQMKLISFASVTTAPKCMKVALCKLRGTGATLDGVWRADLPAPSTLFAAITVTSVTPM